MKGGLIVLTEIRRRFHAGQHDADALGRRRVDDGGEVVVRLRRGQPAQGVVAAKRDDENPRLGLEHVVHAAQAARGRVAGHAGVHALDQRVALVRELPLHELGNA